MSEYIECQLKKCCYTCSSVYFKINKMSCMWELKIKNETGDPNIDVCPSWEPNEEICKKLKL